MSKTCVKDGRTAVRRIKAMNRNPNPCSKEAANALARFLGLPRTEGAFYLEFQRLAPSEALALRHFWGIDDDWRLFARICRFFAL